MIDYRIYSSNIEDFVEYLNKAYNVYVSHTYLTYNNMITVYTFIKISFYSWTANRIYEFNVYEFDIYSILECLYVLLLICRD